MIPMWKTAKDLGVLADGSYFEKQLEAIAPGRSIRYRVIAGHLPTGVQLTNSGQLVGVPTVMNDLVGEVNQQISFTVRAETDQGRLADRTFTILVSGVQAPTIQTITSNLGVYYDGSYFDYQLVATDNHPGSVLTWRFVRGRLPPGVTLSRDGHLQGFLYQNKVADQAFEKIGWDKDSWDRFMFDFIRQQHDTDYEFTVELSDGVNYSRQTYVMRLIAKDLLTADRTIRTVDETEIGVDRTPLHLPFVTTMPQILPAIRPETARQDTYFAFKFDAVDFDGDEIYYEITSLDQKGFDQDGDTVNHTYGVAFDMDEFDSSDYPMPKYLGLDNQTGWYTGKIVKQVTHSVDYEFQIYTRKAYNRDLQGYRSNFIVSVRGQVDENITWLTNPDLGTLDNGSTCLLQIEAVNSAGTALEYYVKGNGGRTPQGVILQKTGMIAGRATFDYFKLDRDQTKLDSGQTTCDKVYTFTVVAQTANRSAYSERTFTIAINRVNQTPYENLYLKGFPNADQRILFKSIMDRQDLFPDQLIYRLDDPYYGKARDLRFLFMAGIRPSDLAIYIQALSRNHYTKSILFGNVKTAVALDDNYNVLYEVVYLDVIDDQEGVDPVTGHPASPSQTISLSKNKNTYREDNGFELLELTPNSLGNMSQRIKTSVGVANASTLPQWMTCPQLDYDRPGRYLTPLGYVRAVILAYTVPGAAKLIAYRLQNANFGFNRIPFRTDRYQLDNYLTKNYDLDLDQFIPGKETTIDQTPAVAQRYRDMGTVDYAVPVSFSNLNGRTVDYVVQNGGLDGVVDFANGQTVIFTQPETFGADTTGYFDKILYGNADLKSAVYQIRIVDNVIALDLARQTQPGDIVTVLQGITYAGRRLNFEAYPLHGTVPRWWRFALPLVSDPTISDFLVQPHQETTFDQRGTRFFSYRDQYADLDSNAKYIKFPKSGVFI